MPRRTVLSLGLGIALLVAPVLGRGGKAIESNPERDKALAEADKKAFEENMAAYNEKVKPLWKSIALVATARRSKKETSI